MPPQIKINVYTSDKLAANIYTFQAKNHYCLKNFNSKLKSQRAGGLIIYRANCTVALQTADCVPLILSHRQEPLVIVLHLDWLGTAINLTQKTLNHLTRKYRLKAEDFRAFIGPSICQKYYSNRGWKGRLKSLIFKFFGWNTAVAKIANRWHFALAATVKQQLLLSGVSDVTQSNQCTYCDNLPSKRRGKQNGQQVITEVTLTCNV